MSPDPFFYSLTGAVLCLVLLAALIVLWATPPRVVVNVAEWVWAGALLDVVFELALIAIAALVALPPPGEPAVWAYAGVRRDAVVCLVVYVVFVAGLRRKVDRWIDDGGDGGGTGGDVDHDDPGGGGMGVWASLLAVVPATLRGPLTPLSSRAPLVRAMRSRGAPTAGPGAPRRGRAKAAAREKAPTEATQALAHG
ncbi:hypothetical protein ACI78V_11035 [Geodermatophilus sp. SYSU D00742]